MKNIKAISATVLMVAGLDKIAQKLDVVSGKSAVKETTKPSFNSVTCLMD